MSLNQNLLHGILPYYLALDSYHMSLKQIILHGITPYYLVWDPDAFRALLISSWTGQGWVKFKAKDRVQGVQVLRTEMVKTVASGRVSASLPVLGGWVQPWPSAADGCRTLSTCDHRKDPGQAAA